MKPLRLSLITEDIVPLNTVSRRFDRYINESAAFDAFKKGEEKEERAKVEKETGKELPKDWKPPEDFVNKWEVYFGYLDDELRNRIGPMVGEYHKTEEIDVPYRPLSREGPIDPEIAAAELDRPTKRTKRSDWRPNNNYTADEVHFAILELWQDAIDKYGLEQWWRDNFEETLDKIREEWRTRPSDWDDKIDGKWEGTPEIGYLVYDKDDKKNGITAGDRYYGEVREFYPKHPPNTRMVYYHRIGNGAYLSEKEHLLAVADYHVVAGSIGSATGMEARQRHNTGTEGANYRYINAPDTGGSAVGKVDWERQAKITRDKVHAAAVRDAEGQHIAGGRGSSTGHVLKDPVTGKPMKHPSAEGGGSVGRGQLHTGTGKIRDQSGEELVGTPRGSTEQPKQPEGGKKGPSTRRVDEPAGPRIKGGTTGGTQGSGGGSVQYQPKKKKQDDEHKGPKKYDIDDSINRLADAISDDVNDTWVNGSLIIDNNWQDTYRLLDERARDNIDVNSLLPSDLYGANGYYATIIRNGSGINIYLSEDINDLDGYRVVRANQVPDIISDNNYILGGGQIIILQEDYINDDMTRDWLTTHHVGMTHSRETDQILMKLATDLDQLKDSEDWPIIQDKLKEILGPFLE